MSDDSSDSSFDDADLETLQAELTKARRAYEAVKAGEDFSESGLAAAQEEIADLERRTKRKRTDNMALALHAAIILSVLYMFVRFIGEFGYGPLAPVAPAHTPENTAAPPFLSDFFKFLNLQ